MEAREQAMKVSYFQDTDTLYVAFAEGRRSTATTSKNHRCGDVSSALRLFMARHGAH
jgi:hypothetical protein